MQLRLKVFGLAITLISNIILPPSIMSQDVLTPISEDVLTPDSIKIKAINEHYKSQTYAKPEDVLQLTLLHEKLAAKTNNQQEIAKALNQRSYAYYIMGDIKNSMQALKQGIAVTEKLNDEVSLLAFYGNLANLLSAEGQHKDAIHYYHKGLDMFRKAGEWENEALALTNIGIQLTSLEGYDLALNHFEEALAIYKEKGRMDATGLVLMGMSTVYFYQGKLDIVINTGKEAIILLEKDNNLATKSEVCFILAKTYQKKGDKSKARFYLDETLQTSRDLNNNSFMFDISIFDAKLSLDNDINTATKKAENLLGQLNGEIAPKIKSDLYELLYYCYKGQGKYDKSLEMYEKHKMFSDSAATQKLKIDIMRQVIQKEYDDKLYKQEIESNKSQLDLRASLRNKLVVIVILSFVVLGALLYYSRTKITQEKQKGEALLNELNSLRKQVGKVVGTEKKADLNKEKLELAINKKINETDWIVLNILLEDPVISNQDLSEKAYMSVDGIGSSLRRMYEYFDIPNSKYMKMVLLLKAVKLSNQGALQDLDKD